MGAWGTGALDNDEACDWAADLEESGNLETITQALERVAACGKTHELHSGDACEGLAACEAVARLKGHWGVRNAFTERLDRWVEAHPGEPSAKLVALACAAIDRILAPPSELLELWEENDEDLPAWREGVLELRTRVAH